MASTPIVSFSEGEVAYAVNQYSEKSADEAIEFINLQMNSKEPRQVRWAMFYLSKFKVERAIPIFLQHLDYQYTTVPVLTEAFPALQALIQMGKPAASAALQALTTESDAQRLELLCQVVLGIDSLNVGKRRIETLVENTKDAQQRQKINAALAKAVQSHAAPNPPAT